MSIKCRNKITRKGMFSCQFFKCFLVNGFLRRFHSKHEVEVAQRDCSLDLLIGFCSHSCREIGFFLGWISS